MIDSNSDWRGLVGTIKRICETELGIVSQCCQPKQAAKNSKQYLENVALKINVKVNYGSCEYYLSSTLITHSCIHLWSSMLKMSRLGEEILF